MSGHSHWAGIKHKKGLADIQRSKAFSKLAREITIAAREGPDPAINPKLRTAIEKARSLNMPSENIERAIKKGSGGADAQQLQEILLEAYGPGGVALLITCITDNKNRTLGEIKQILGRFDGKLVEGGAVQWLFERKGEIAINVKAQSSNVKKEDVELAAIEAGAQDLSWDKENTLFVYTTTADLEKVKTALTEKSIVVESAVLSWVAKEHIETSADSKESLQKLFEALDEQDDVQEIYTNANL